MPHYSAGLKSDIQSCVHHYCVIEVKIPLHCVSTVGKEECGYWQRDETEMVFKFCNAISGGAQTKKINPTLTKLYLGKVMGSMDNIF